MRKEDSAFANGLFVSPYRVVDLGLKWNCASGDIKKLSFASAMSFVLLKGKRVLSHGLS